MLVTALLLGLVNPENKFIIFLIINYINNKHF